MKNFIEQIEDYIDSYIEHEITNYENEYIFGVRDKAVNHIIMIIKYTIWLLKDLGKPLNINSFRFQLYKPIKADECYKAKRIFNLKWKKYSSLYINLKNSFKLQYLVTICISLCINNIMYVMYVTCFL